MTKNPQKVELPVVIDGKLRGGKRVLDIPLDQLIPDPNQPRTNFNEQALQELAESIENRGLQQYPTVTFSHTKDGKAYYILKTGERRWRACKLKGLKSMTCVVDDVVYDGKRNTARRLEQAAENSSREPHTHEEILTLVEEVVQEEVAKRGTSYGSVQIALNIVAKTFGKSLAWATNYHTLAGLIPELRKMLDEEDEEKRLSFNTALALARAPREDQMVLLLQAQDKVRRYGTKAGYTFIVKSAREIRESRGERLRGRGYDEKTKFMKIGLRLYRLMAELSENRRSSEQAKYMSDMIQKMSVLEVDEMLHNINQGMEGFKALRAQLEKKRASNYASLSYKKAA